VVPRYSVSVRVKGLIQYSVHHMTEYYLELIESSDYELSLITRGDVVINEGAVVGSAF